MTTPRQLRPGGNRGSAAGEDRGRSEADDTTKHRLAVLDDTELQRLVKRLDAGVRASRDLPYSRDVERLRDAAALGRHELRTRRARQRVADALLEVDKLEGSAS
ncbi:MAG: hypothetical protein GEV09_12635 [Pseudonocardiaceae bacterium]|nr:hypothetical protein [Pseudonocardiaceae bacterium]